DEEHFRRWQEAELQPEASAPPAAAPGARARVNDARELPEAPPMPLPTNLQRPIFRGQSPEPSSPLPYWAPQRSAAPHVAQRPPAENDAQPIQSDPYGNVRAVRGQSPVNQAYSTLPAGGAPAMAQGGQVI